MICENNSYTVFNSIVERMGYATHLQLRMGQVGLHQGWLCEHLGNADNRVFSCVDHYLSQKFDFLETSFFEIPFYLFKRDLIIFALQGGFVLKVSFLSHYRELAKLASQITRCQGERET